MLGNEIDKNARIAYEELKMEIATELGISYDPISKEIIFSRKEDFSK